MATVESGHARTGAAAESSNHDRHRRGLVPLVPCDGRDDLRRPGSRGGAEQQIRAGEGRYRRASRPRRLLSDRGCATDRRRRLAADLLHDARWRLVLRGGISAAAPGQRTERQRRRQLVYAAVAQANLAGVRGRSCGPRKRGGGDCGETQIRIESERLRRREASMACARKYLQALRQRTIASRVDSRRDRGRDSTIFPRSNSHSHTDFTGIRSTPRWRSTH